jgi:hypothetical protein
MRRFPVRRRRPARVPVLLTLAALALIAACGDDSNDDGGGSSTPVVEYQGVFGSATKAGRLAFATTTSAIREGMAGLVAAIPMSGTMDFTDGGAQVTLSGTLDGTSLTLTGGGYDFTGTETDGIINGSYTGPESGTFTATLVPDGGFVVQLCGTYAGSDTGVFSLTIGQDRAGGVIIVPDDGSPGQTGRARAKAGSSTDVEVLPDALPSFVIATGTMNGAFNQISGAWDDAQGSSGSFSGSVDACIPAN